MSNVANLEAVRQPPSPSEWLNEAISSAQNKVRTFVIDLTPALARALLARNPANRKISLNMVEKYARDMSQDGWAFNGEPIIVSCGGHLNDGQHRCEAVIQSGRTIPVVLVIGTDRASRLTIDQGKNRMAGDYLAMDGHTDGTALAAAAGYLWQYEHHGRLSGQAFYRPTKTEVMAVVAATPDLTASLSAVPKKGSDAVGGRSMLAFAHLLFARRAGKPAADEFLDMLVTGINLSANSPVLYARNRLTTNRGRLRPNEKAELILRAWGAWRRRETPKTLPILNDALPIVER